MLDSTMLPDAFWQLHNGLRREGPGSDASTGAAIRLLPGPVKPAILDLGCGPGAHSLVLAQSLELPVVAVDTHQPFLDRLEQAAREAGLDGLIETRNVSMVEMDHPPESVGLIWCEAAIYSLGVSLACDAWKPFLRPGGFLVFSDATWLVDERPEEAVRFWDEAYAGMTTVSGNLSRISMAGLEPVDTFVLPPDDWWREYYNPLSERAKALEPQASTDPSLRAVIEEHQREIELYRRYGDAYGYAFYIARRPAEPTRGS